MVKVEKSNSRRKIFVKVPGNSVKIHYVARRPKAHICSVCGKPLKGTPNHINSQIKKLSKTQKRPSRIYGGQICHECLRKMLIKEALSLDN